MLGRKWVGWPSLLIVGKPGHVETWEGEGSGRGGEGGKGRRGALRRESNLKGTYR